MCFYDDYDWHASLVIEESRVSDGSQKCHECGDKIPYWTTYTWIFMQEHEECRVCEWEEADEPCEQHDYGETFTYQRCEACSKILKAIEAVETDENCPAYARRPALGELAEVFRNSYGYGSGKYAERAVLMFQELKDHPLLNLNRIET